MKNSWTKAVNTINKQRYVIPEGWSTRDQVAEDLQCAPDKVATLLKPGLENGTFDKQDFSVWDDGRRMAVRVTCYRIAGEGKAAPPAAVTVTVTPKKKGSAKTRPVDADELDRARRCIERNPHLDDYGVAKNVRVSVYAVRAAREAIKADKKRK